jgi:S1-C subfamily serine protease
MLKPRIAVVRAGWLALGVATLGFPMTDVQAQAPVHLEQARDEMFNLVVNRRARLGLKVNLQAQDTDSIGARVDAVTPGGPAAKAGIRSGDVITRLDGNSLLTAPELPREPGRSLPGLRLIELAARLGPNDTVPLEFRRGTDRKVVTLITAGDPRSLEMGNRIVIPRDFAQQSLEGMRAMGSDPEIGDLDIRLPRVAMLYGGELSEIELAPLNPDLGQYFGTSEGILVISAPRGSSLGLRGGDVVLAVDQRKPASPSHLLRILRSYDHDESFKIDILRNRKHETITAKRDEPKQ